MKPLEDYKNWIILLSIVVITGVFYQNLKRASGGTLNHLFSLFSGSSVASGAAELFTNPAHLLAEPGIMLATVLAGLFIFTTWRNKK